MSAKKRIILPYCQYYLPSDIVHNMIISVENDFQENCLIKIVTGAKAVG